LSSPLENSGDLIIALLEDSSFTKKQKKTKQNKKKKKEKKKKTKTQKQTFNLGR